MALRKLSPRGLAWAALLCSFPLAAQAPDDLELDLVTFAGAPTALRHAGDSSGRLFIVERAGRVRVFDSSSGLLVQPFLDISSEIDSTASELGLLGLTFHPDYARNGYFYVDYAHSLPVLETVIARYTVSAGDPDVADPLSEQIVLTIPQDFANHNGGDVHFGPDGYLYIGIGDGGSGGDPFNHAQDLGSLLGKMLRLDVDGGSPYALPPDNPFVGVTGRDEIWAYGLRNPWRWSFDRLTGDLLIADVGQDDLEEIDFQPASSAGGENYGWDCREGSQVYTGDNSGTTLCAGPMVDPILEYPHSDGMTSIGCSVTGGYRYRGHGIVGFQGTYVYADFCTARMWFATETGPGTWSATEWPGNLATSIVSFGEDEAGELYVVSLGGGIYRFASPSSVFTDGFESGDVAAWSGSVPTP